MTRSGYLLRSQCPHPQLEILESLGMHYKLGLAETCWYVFFCIIDWVFNEGTITIKGMPRPHEA